jgi:hypothetical protein
MPNVNPPVDEARADQHPELRFRTGGAEVWISARVEAPTLPRPSGFRFGILVDGDGRRFAGYLWERPGS